MSQKRLPKVQLTQIVSTPPPTESKPVVVTTTGDLSYVDSLGGGGFYLHKITDAGDGKHLVMSGSPTQYTGKLHTAILNDKTALTIANAQTSLDDFDYLTKSLTPIIKYASTVYYLATLSPSVQSASLGTNISISSDEVEAL